MTDLYLTLGLLVLNIFQFVFWSWQNQMLVNKLMCRDLAEYKHVTEPPRPKESKSFDEYEDEHEEKEILAELNGWVSGR